MSYYQRPMGDYKTYGYAGDPGFLSGLWKGIKTVGKAILGIPPKQTPPRPPPIMMPPVSPGVTMGMGMIPRLPRPPGPSFPGMGTIIQPTGGKIGMKGSPHDCPPSGYHYAKDGSGRLVRNRRMNVANPKALRRAIRRTDGFVKLAKRALKGTGYAVRRA